MKASEFVSNIELELPKSGSVSWKSPSNIALVKYWGKKLNQIPANPSISLTLDACHTKTSVQFQEITQEQQNFSFDLFFEGEEKPAFKPKIQTFFERIESFVPFLKKYHFTIHTSNSFPHSSGIASSASGMAALALCLMEIEQKALPEMTEDFFYRKASFLARLGSGSACRSIRGSLVQWGMHKPIPESSDLYGITYPFEVNEVFEDYHDTILLVHKGQKTVSSTVGHGLMEGHPFAINRFEQAHSNLNALKSIFAEGNLAEFIKIVESEALTLHAMMMTSHPYFLLMKPDTLAILEKIWNFRRETGLHACFTLDAGANVHLLYPSSQKERTIQFVQDELVAHCENGHYICDRVGNGSKRLM
ncbi:diphosphomevalonate/mevalonate 3,5-bisphosphate decarboxylase family protein [Croceivirga thetidis]|uniref:Diphosphomevalonate decarboxylase n=1 Tax=Croceivirga thetidis TaxID=2721623 RepID=A0ABX1GPN0_9FLAO|nr:diphosphomevalonate decarboxylase [Croceivirga thetidis]NKI31638.1 diphosphomevalonate decarboxylase [Croceivirga thetidis]